MTRRRLLHIFSTFAVGGPQIRFTQIANALGDRYHHMVLALDGRYQAADRLGAGVSVELLGDPPAKAGLIHSVRTFRALLKACRPDKLVTYNWGAIEWALAVRGTGIPHLHAEDGFGPEERERQLPRRIWMRRLALRGRTVVVPSRTLERIAIGTWRLSPKRVRYVPNGVDLNRFGQAAEPAWVDRLAALGSGPLIGAVSALRREKRFDRLIAAVAALPTAFDARLVIVGDGVERAALEAEAAARGIAERTLFTGRLDRPEVLLGALDIFAVSSDTEQMPVNLLEAMAARLPVAATAVGDIPVIVAAANRPYLAPCDPGALSDRISWLAADRAVARAVGLANRAKAEDDYAEADMVAAWRDLFDGGQVI